MQNEIAKLYRHYNDKLNATAFAILQKSTIPAPADVAADVVSEVYTKLIKNAPELSGASLYTYATRAVVNTTYNRLDAAGAKHRALAPVEEHAESTWGAADIVPRSFPNPERVYLWRERARLLNEALDLKVSDKDRAVFEAVKFDGMTQQQAADLFNLSQATAYRRLTTAVNAVSSYLAERDGE